MLIIYIYYSLTSVHITILCSCTHHYTVFMYTLCRVYVHTLYCVHVHITILCSYTHHYTVFMYTLWVVSSVDNSEASQFMALVFLCLTKRI